MRDKCQPLNAVTEAEAEAQGERRLSVAAVAAVALRKLDAEVARLILIGTLEDTPRNRRIRHKSFAAHSQHILISQVRIGELATNCAAGTSYTCTDTTPPAVSAPNGRCVTESQQQEEYGVE